MLVEEFTAVNARRFITIFVDFHRHIRTNHVDLLAILLESIKIRL